MTIVFAVFAVILGAANYICMLSCHSAIKERLSVLERDYGKTDFSTDDRLIILIYDDSRSYTVLTGKNLFSETQIKEIVTAATERYPEIVSSSVGKIYFRVFKIPNGSTVLVAADMTEYFDKATTSTLNILFLLIAIYVVLALIVWGASYKIFQPIKESLYKQSKFVSDASHELKTPIAVISANADVLSSGESNKYLESIKSQTKRLNLLVTDMLALTRMDERTTHVIKENFCLSDVVTETVLPFDAVAFEHGKVLLTEIEQKVNYSGDRESVKKIINILMDNAVKYSSKGGTIKVTLTKTTLTVYNSGSDVKDEDSYKIFERFYRGELSRSRETGGSGLGLSIAKSLADANRWNISAKSRYGESMTITVNF